MLIIIFIPSGLLGKLVVTIIVFIFCFISRLGFKTFSKTLWISLVMLVLLVFINWLVMKSPGLIVSEHHRSMFFIDKLWNKISDDSHHSFNYFYFPLIGGKINTIDIIYAQPISTINQIFVKLNSINGWLVITYTKHWYTLSLGSLTYAINTSWMIFLSLLTVTLAISSTNNVQLAYGIEKILTPLKFIKIPIQEWAMIIAIALRFVPTLINQAGRILNAQASRGVDIRNGNIKNKFVAIVSLIVPLFVLAFYAADDLANAMEVRGYNPANKRTRYRSYKLKVFDYCALVLMLLVFAFFIFYCIRKYCFGLFGPIDCWLLYGAN
ncbi:MAG: energy-coupling factor transporter transmembrane protein EcfT [Mycoplasmataceae bacterium]|nr:energy-coupling factor transporter transmembrane protein EcfT [Mycoplasmataceae bacterium]